MSENKKILNATPTKIGDIQFKSKLEARIYTYLKSEGFNPIYEGMKFILWEGFKPTVPFYTRNSDKEFVPKMSKTIDITYTPDFTFMYKGKLILIEVKGMTNDVFGYKFKMFRKLLEEKEYRDSTILFEIFTLKDLKKCIEIIRNEEES